MTGWDILLAVLGILAPLGAAVIARQNTHIDTLYKRIGAQEKYVAEHYVRRDDFKDAIADLKRSVEKIGDNIKEDMKKLEDQLDLFRKEISG